MFAEDDFQQSRPAAKSSGQSAVGRESLEHACQQVARHWKPRLGEECQLIVREPLVIAGDMSSEELDRWYRETIAPAVEGLQASYVDAEVDHPVSVLLFASQESYTEHIRELFGDEDVSIFGYYKPGHRTLVMNISTGAGTLVHELTHALLDFDFPAVPVWFNEGLASLHEQVRFGRRDDQVHLAGLDNWRLPILQRALERGRLPTLESLVCADDFRLGRASVNYAQARYFCLYLQEQGVLELFYRQLRANHEHDPLGAETLFEVLPDHDWSSLEADFRRWVGERSFEA